MIKEYFRLMFYEIPKDIWPDAKWEKEDHIQTYYIDLYKMHESYQEYSKVSHIVSLVILNILSFFDWRIAISRIFLSIGLIKGLNANSRRKNKKNKIKEVI
jgi:hypothetical protein